MKNMKNKIKNKNINVNVENDTDTEIVVDTEYNTDKPGKVDKDEELKNLSITAALGRIVAGSYYDYQQIRIGEANRIRSIIRQKLENLSLAKPEEKKEDSEKHQDKYTDVNLSELLIEAVKQGKFTAQEYEYMNKVLETQANASKSEDAYKTLMQEFVAQEEIYTKFLSKIRGIGPVISANLIKELGYCEKAPHISSVWKFTGNHTVDDKAPKREKGKKLDFDVRLRSMVWNIGDSFIKQRTPLYRDIYDNEKMRQLALMEKEEQNKADPKLMAQSIKYREDMLAKGIKLPTAPLNKKHADLRARRKMAKIFLAHYWQACMDIKGIVLDPQASLPYPVAKLGHTHIIKWTEAVEANDKYRAAQKATDKTKPSKNEKVVTAMQNVLENSINIAKRLTVKPVKSVKPVYKPAFKPSKTAEAKIAKVKEPKFKTKTPTKKVKKFDLQNGMVKKKIKPSKELAFKVKKLKK